MPTHSSMRTFLQAVRTGKTDTTEALDIIFATPGELADHPNFEEFAQSGALDTLPVWARRELRKVGLGSAEINHLDEWPNDQKEQVREALVQAIEEDQSVGFYWTVHDGADEETEISSGQDTVSIAFVFRSPERRVRAIGPDNITVDVGA
ncbi:MAG: hypothetical protein WEE64_11855 [Dehalococcoidia bacterium]